MKIVTIVGARPHLVKLGPLSRALRAAHDEVLVHTGQHYAPEMSDVFFDELDLPAPDHHLGIGSRPHGAQTGAMLEAVERALAKERPDAVVVYGDTNSTLAGALAAAKLRIPVAHVEAGMRSFNRAMPEEINRVLTDHLSTWLFTVSDVGVAHLAREGITAGVHTVGDVGADALELYREQAVARTAVRERLGVVPGHYHLATVHRAENTDDPRRLGAIFEALGRLGEPVVIPLHPRTRDRLAELAIPLAANLRMTPPLGYLDMLALQAGAACVLTDSGGVQREAYYLRVPCVTLRDETEWVETVTAGWNVLVGADPERIVSASRGRSDPGRTHPPLYGDGATAPRIAAILSTCVASPRS